jgi:hypothetical protein
MSVQRLMLSFLSKDNKSIKPGKQVRLAEVATLVFITRNTTITVPRVLDVVSVDGILQIVQQFIDASALADCPDQKRSSMQVQLKITVSIASVSTAYCLSTCGIRTGNRSLSNISAYSSTSLVMVSSPRCKSSTPSKKVRTK